MRYDRPDDMRDHLVGRRVVVRYRLHGADYSATDVLGVVESWQDGVLRVRRTSGSGEGDAAVGTSSVVSIDQDDVLVAKPIPARPVTRRDVRDLEMAAAKGWQALETDHRGGWLLRAAAGFTRRANSCMPLADPDQPIGDAIDGVERWYRARGLPPSFQIPSLLGGGLTAALDARGWSRSDDVLVLTADVAAMRAGARADLPTVRIDDQPDDEWLAGYHYRGDALPQEAVEVLVNADNVGFASVDDSGRRVAIARGAISDAPSGRRWLGITAVEVAPDARRRGLGSHVVAGLAEWAANLGAGDAYLQVEDMNTAAQAAYRKLGFVDHHAYHYRWVAH